MNKIKNWLAVALAFTAILAFANLGPPVAAQEKRIDFVQTTSVGIGAAPTSLAPRYITVQERGQGVIHQTILTINAMPVTVADATVGVGTKIYTFPEGRIFILGGEGQNLTFTTTSVLASTLNASVSCRWGIGTVTQTNATLATTEQDLVPVTTFTSSATINVANTATSAALAAAAQFDGTSAAKAAFFNISVPLNTDIDADATVTITGTVTITWINLGDY